MHCHAGMLVISVLLFSYVINKKVVSDYRTIAKVTSILNIMTSLHVNSMCAWGYFGKISSERSL